MAAKRTDAKLLSIRTAVILALALLVAIGAGLLTYLQDHALAPAVLVAAAAWAASVTFFNALIDKKPTGCNVSRAGLLRIDRPLDIFCACPGRLRWMDWS